MTKFPRDTANTRKHCRDDEERFVVRIGHWNVHYNRDMNWILKFWESSLHILVYLLIWQFKKDAMAITPLSRNICLCLFLCPFLCFHAFYSFNEGAGATTTICKFGNSCPIMGTNEIWGLKNLDYWIMISMSSNSGLLSKHLVKKILPLNIFISKSGPEYFLWGGY